MKNKKIVSTQFRNPAVWCSTILTVVCGALLCQDMMFGLAAGLGSFFGLVSLNSRLLEKHGRTLNGVWLSVLSLAVTLVVGTVI